MGKQKKAKDLEMKTSVKSYKEGIDAEKDSMDAYAKKMGTSVRSLQTSVKSLRNQFKAHSKDLQNASLEMKEEGIKRMSGKVNKFKAEIRDQIKENKEALTHMGSGVKLLLSEINGKKKDYQEYTKKEFQAYIRAFWG